MAETTDPMIAALLRERDGYIAQGKTDRVALVDEQLRLRGHETEPDSKPDPDAGKAAEKPPRGRQAPPKHTA